MESLQKEINVLEAAIKADRKKKVRIGLIKHELDLLRNDLLESNKKMKKEKKDVDELEKKNMKSLFTEILGDKEDQLDRERQEYLQEVLHHNGLIDEISNLEYELKILQSNVLEDQDKLKRKLDHLIKSKEKALKGSPSHKKRLLQFDAQLHKLHYKLVNVEEALDQSASLKAKLEEVVYNLKHVKKWGPYKMHGKGHYSSYNKKTYIDKANKQAVVVNVFIKKFDQELKDVFPEMDVHLTMEQFENFLDHFYDNLITDWVIQRKLGNAIHSITNMMDKLSRITMMLEKEQKIHLDSKKNTEDEKREFIKSNP